MVVYLYVYSNDESASKKFIQFINKIIKNKILHIKIFYIYHRKTQAFKTFTVLKSPHVNKKAQEHFELYNQQNKIKLILFQTQKLFILLKTIQMHLFPNIFIKINIHIGKTKINLHQTNPDIFKMESSKILLNSNFINYIKNLDVFGELSMKNDIKCKSLDSSVGRAKD
jgi:ribosomal protein S10